MIQKQVCMLGGVAVGKTSLVRRFVHGLFSEKYLTTMGVKIDRKVVRVDDDELGLVLWDIHGEDEFTRIALTYLRGASGLLLVMDGTRRHTLETAVRIGSQAVATVGEVPRLMLINKADLENEWDIGADDIEQLTAQGWSVIRTSAKSGQGVEEAFLVLAKRILHG